MNKKKPQIGSNFLGHVQSGLLKNLLVPYSCIVGNKIIFDFMEFEIKQAFSDF